MAEESVWGSSLIFLVSGRRFLKQFGSHAFGRQGDIPNDLFQTVYQNRREVVSTRRSAKNSKIWTRFQQTGEFVSDAGELAWPKGPRRADLTHRSDRLQRSSDAAATLPPWPGRATEWR